MKNYTREEKKKLLAIHNLDLAKNSRYQIGLFVSEKTMNCSLFKKEKDSRFGVVFITAIETNDEAQIDSTLSAFSKHIHAIYPL